MSQFQRGQFRAYRAINKIHVGKYEMDIALDDIFEYDGYTVRYAGTEYSVPQLRGLFGQWFVPEKDVTSTYHAQPAGVEVSPATPEAREKGQSFVMEEASEEEAVVGTMQEQKQIRKAADARDTDRLVELRAQRRQRAARIQGQTSGPGEVSLDSNPDAPPPKNADEVDADIEAALMEDAHDNIQDTRQFRQATPVHGAGGKSLPVSERENEAVARANAINQQRIASKADELEKVDPRKTREEMGGTRHDTPDSGARRVGKGGKYQLIQDDSGGEVVGEYQFSDGASVGDQIVESGDVRPTNVMKVAQSRPVQVGSNPVKARRGPPAQTGAQVIDDPNYTHEPQAVRAPSSTQVPREGNVGIDEVRGGTTGDVEVTQTGDDLEELLPDAAVAGRIAQPRKPVVEPEAPTEAEELAAIVDEWNTRRHWKTRVQEAIDAYGDWPEAIEAIKSKDKMVAKHYDETLAAQGG